MTRVDTGTDNKERQRLFVEALQNSGGSERGGVRPPCHSSTTPPRPACPTGPEGVRAVLGAIRAGFPDHDAEVIHMVAEDDLVATYKTFTGTHTGDFLGTLAIGPARDDPRHGLRPLPRRPRRRALERRRRRRPPGPAHRPGADSTSMGTAGDEDRARHRRGQRHRPRSRSRSPRRASRSSSPAGAASRSRAAAAAARRRRGRRATDVRDPAVGRGALRRGRGTLRPARPALQQRRHRRTRPSRSRSSPSSSGRTSSTRT